MSEPRGCTDCDAWLVRVELPGVEIYGSGPPTPLEASDRGTSDPAGEQAEVPTAADRPVPAQRAPGGNREFPQLYVPSVQARDPGFEVRYPVRRVADRMNA